ncbi:hypothetical protein HY041_01825 [Candidatus Roizmanbacteria bacterium]|nr:hypothetical protein [Candidatus Roizmanbacteria bacterium]
MGAQRPNHLDLITQYPNLFSVDGNLIGPPKTTWQLLAANQVLRSNSTFNRKVQASGILVENQTAKGVLTCSLYGNSTGYQFGNGITIEGDIAEKDIIEPHLVLNPQNDGVTLHYSSPNPDPDNPDIAVYGIFDGKGGTKIPIAGSENKLGAAILEGGLGGINLFKDGGVFAISVAPELLGEPGDATYIPPDSLLNLARGGVYLVCVRGKMILPKILPRVTFNPNAFGYDFGTKSLSLPTRSLPTSAAASAGYGEEVGSSINVSFNPDWTTAIPIFFRLRVDKTMPPLQGTNAYVAWLKSKEQTGRKYSAITCNHCGNQAGPAIATLSESHIQVHAGCSGCGAHSFSLTQYIRQNK